MADQRPVLLGMNNPHSSDPRWALAPHPRGVAGWRLWRMVNEVCGVSRAEYMRLTSRHNLLDEPEWCPIRARGRVEGLWEMLQGRRVVVLGAAVRNVLWLPEEAPAAWTLHRGVTWAYLPHPSGMNRLYNDELMRRVAGYLIEEELVRAGLGA